MLLTLQLPWTNLVPVMAKELSAMPDRRETDSEITLASRGWQQTTAVWPARASCAFQALYWVLEMRRGQESSQGVCGLGRSQATH